MQITRLQEEVQDCNTKICQLSLKLKQQDNDILHLREEVKKLLTELSKTRITLKSLLTNYSACWIYIEFFNTRDQEKF